MANFIFPMAPVEQQERIVNKVERFFHICDELKLKLQAAKSTQTYLADSISLSLVN
ncbi:uncharacterized protein METZ01_LOCUS418451 [marine metagenome]|uniref:Type I restriction modification DNA specificity domain-containing protein n=1 Tax=marine metagenome TaxID=408172 RepID=A0A382X311_9ZZZZ